ncbi:O-antigen ligase family protein [Wukongibacter baidiensis]|uniref:O-antigen ligase family protein n=1 Tax=Wukongibacter baidiensis TaxID=1723361 RepID=UPI003D7FA9D7
MNEGKANSKYKWFGLAAGIVVGALSYYFGVLQTIKIVVALVALGLVTKKPVYAMAVYILSIPFLSDMSALIMGIVVIFSYGINFIREGHFEFRFTPANLLLLLFTISIVSNTFLSISPNGSFRDFTIHSVAIGVLFVLIHSKKSHKDIYLINVFLTVTAAIVSVYGIYQFFAGAPMGSGWVDMSQNPDVKIRVYSVFENPNILAEYLIMIFPVSMALFFHSDNHIKKAFFGVTSFLILICDGVTYSRGSWLGLVFAIVVFIFLIDFKKIILLIPAGIGSLFVLPDSILQRIGTIGSLQDSSNYYRVNLWNMAIDILKDYWYSGIGIGYMTFREISPFYIRTAMDPYHTHNTYLQIAIELGVIGLVLFLLLILSIFRMGVRSVINTKSKFVKYFSAAYLASLSGILVNGLAEHVLYNPKILLVFWFIIAMNLCMYNLYNEAS